MKVGLNQLDRTILRALLTVGAFADKQGVPIYLVGGAVRDLILSKATVDIDLVLEGDAIAFGRKLRREMGGKLIAHKDFKTATLDLKDGPRIDLVTARSESYPQPGSLPRVKSADLKADAWRRDFTINSLALSMNMGPRFCDVVDHTGGLQDLQSGKVRVMHEQSFIDDPTRIFRAVRYEQRYGFRMERSTLRLIKEALARDVFASISGQRYLNEMLKIFEEATVVPALKRLRGLGVLDYMCPKFGVDLKLIARVQKNIACRIYPGDWERICEHGLWWLALLGSNSAAAVAQVSTRMPFTKFERQTFGQLPAANRACKKLSEGVQRPSKIFELLHGFHEETLCYLWERSQTLTGRRNLSRYLDAREVKLRIDGEELRAMGVRSGRKIGETLKQLLQLKMDLKFQTRQEEMNHVRSIIKEKQSEVQL